MKKQLDKWLNKSEHPSNILPGISYLTEAFKKTDTPVLKWHKSSCRSNFMSSKHLDSFPDKVIPVVLEENDEHAGDDTEDNGLAGDISGNDNVPKNVSSRVLRSQMKPYDKLLHCVVCVAGVEAGALSRCMTTNRHSQLFHLSLRLYIRLLHAYDAIAGDIMYHSTCLPMPKPGEGSSNNITAAYSLIYSTLKQELQSLTARGHGVLLSECWERFNDLCNHHIICHMGL